MEYNAQVKENTFEDKTEAKISLVDKENTFEDNTEVKVSSVDNINKEDKYVGYKNIFKYGKEALEEENFF